jgi:hypothetical protein
MDCDLSNTCPGQIWFEIKFKGNRGGTDKIRARCDNFIYPCIDGSLLQMLVNAYH